MGEDIILPENLTPEKREMMIAVILRGREFKKINEQFATYQDDVMQFVKLFQRIAQRRQEILPQLVKKFEASQLTQEDRQNYIVLTVGKLNMLYNIYEKNISQIRQGINLLIEKVEEPEFKMMLGQPSEMAEKKQKAYIDFAVMLEELFEEGSIIDKFMMSLQEMINEEKEAVLESQTPLELKKRITEIKNNFNRILTETTNIFRRFNKEAWDKVYNRGKFSFIEEAPFATLGVGLMAGAVAVSIPVGIAFPNLPTQFGAIAAIPMIAGFWAITYDLLFS